MMANPSVKTKKRPTWCGPIHFDALLFFFSDRSRFFSEGAPTQSGCANLLVCFFCRQLHENDRIGILRGCVSLAAPLDPPIFINIIDLLKH